MSNDSNEIIIVRKDYYAQVRASDLKEVLKERGYTLFTRDEQNERDRNVTNLVERIGNLEQENTKLKNALQLINGDLKDQATEALSALNERNQAQQHADLLEKTLKKTEARCRELEKEVDYHMHRADDLAKAFHEADKRVKESQIRSDCAWSESAKHKQALESASSQVKTFQSELSIRNLAVEALRSRIKEANSLIHRGFGLERIAEALADKEEESAKKELEEVKEQLELLKQDYVGATADRKGLQEGFNTVLMMWAVDREKLREITAMVKESTDKKYGPGGSGMYAKQFESILSKRYPSSLSAPFGLDHAQLSARIEGLNFKKEWAKKKKQGYQYGNEALEQVKFGFEIALEALKREGAE